MVSATSGWIRTIVGSFWGSVFLIMRVVILHGISHIRVDSQQFWIILGISFLIMRVVILHGISDIRVDDLFQRLVMQNHSKINDNDQSFGDSGGTSDAKQQQASMKMSKSLVIQEGSKKVSIPNGIRT